MKHSVTLLLIIGLVLSFSFTNTMDPAVGYVEEHKELAISEMHRSGIPASIKLAQAIVETNSGRSVLATRAKNHFGIKCKSYWEGPRYFYTDDDRDDNGNLVPSCFRMYDSVEDSFRDHSDFLVNSERYALLFDGGSRDYVHWATGLQQCGYATDTNYSRRLMSIVEKYNLDAFDEAAGQ